MSRRGRHAAGTESIRFQAARVLDRILASRAPARPFLDALAPANGRDRRLAHELVLGTLRWLRRLDAVIESAADRPVSKIDAEALTPLRLGVYQLLFLERVPDHAVVDEAVRDVRRRGCGRGAAGFVNAVLRRVAGRRELAAWPVRSDDPIERLAIEQSHPTFLVRRWGARWPRDAVRELLLANNRRRAPGLLCLEEPDDLRSELEEEGILCRASPLAPRGLLVRRGDPLGTRAFVRGALYVQDPASQAAALIPTPRPGERILDAAAAPGGKGFALAASEPRVRLTALDRSAARLATLLENQRRLGRVAPAVAGDAALPPFVQRFDRVVADLPCSGTGTLARHPELKWRLSRGEIARLAARGLAILEGLAECVGHGGRLVVITCSIEQEENDVVVAEFTERRPDFSLVDLGTELEPPLDAYLVRKGKWQVLPAADNDGFTVHVLARRSSRRSER